MPRPTARRLQSVDTHQLSVRLRAGAARKVGSNAPSAGARAAGGSKVFELDPGKRQEAARCLDVAE